jgi:hypothetical protein
MPAWTRYILVLTAISTVALAQQPADSTQPLSVFLGHWDGGGTFYETKLSKPDKVTSSGDCDWSPQRRYLICEQTIHDGKGTHSQLNVFNATGKAGEFAYQTFQDGGTPHGSTLTIEGNVWAFQNTFSSDGVQTTVKTTNTFNGDKEDFRVEYSQDNGSHWTTMLEGELHRTKQ